MHMGVCVCGGCVRVSWKIREREKKRCQKWKQFEIEMNVLWNICLMVALNGLAKNLNKKSVENGEKLWFFAWNQFFGYNQIEWFQ